MKKTKEPEPKSFQISKCFTLLYVTLLVVLTKVDVVISSSLAVHLVDKEAGHGFEQQVEDGHPCAEASRVSHQVTAWVEYPEMDDVGQYCQNHPYQKLQGAHKRVYHVN